MALWVVSRHPGTVEWLRRQGLQPDRVVEHLEVAAVAPGDTVVGTLPVHLAAAVCARGATFWFLALDLPRDRRGQELTAEDLEQMHARLEAYWVERCTDILRPGSPDAPDGRAGGEEE